MTTDQLRAHLDQLADQAVGLERWAAELRRQNRTDLDNGILDLILAVRPSILTELPPINLDTWLAADWPLPEVTAALGL